MVPRSLQKILAGCSIAGLLTATILPAGCSRQEDTAKKQEGQETSQDQAAKTADSGTEKAKQPTGKEVQIRGDSG